MRVDDYGLQAVSYTHLDVYKRQQQWLARGLNIKYMKFRLPQEKELHEPDVEIELDEYRSYNRSKRSGLKTSK